MGCVETRNSSEETAVLVAEKALNFHLQQAARVDSIIRKYSPNGKTNPAQLGRIAEILGIVIFSNPPNTKIDDFFRKIISNEEFYDMKDLLVIGILLSQGDPAVKAGLLYQIFDEELTSRIPMNKITGEVLSKIIEHSCSNLPLLVAQGQSLVTNTIKNEKYVNDMIQAKAMCIKNIGDKLAENGNNVTEATFVDVFSSFNQGSLTSSSGWRKYLIDTFVANPPKKAFVNPYKKANK